MMPKLLVRGGSIAAGVGVARGYVDRVHEYCNHRGIELIDRTRHGDNSFDGIGTFHEDIAPHRPEILMIHFGIEDAFFPVYRSEFKENLVRMVRLARELFNPAILMPTSQTFDDTYEMDAVHIYYRTIREVCQDLGCGMVAAHTYWAGYLRDHGLKNADLVQRDGRLPNERGHAVLAEAMMPAVERAISQVLS